MAKRKRPITRKQSPTARSERKIGSILTTTPGMVGQVSDFSLQKVYANPDVAVPAKITIRNEMSKRAAGEASVISQYMRPKKRNKKTGYR